MLICYNGIFNVASRNKEIYFLKSIIDDDLTQVTLLPGAYEIESLNIEIRRILIEEGNFTEANYPFKIKPNFSTWSSIIDVSFNKAGRYIVFTPNDSMRSPLGFKPLVSHEAYNLSDYPVDFFWQYFHWMWFCKRFDFRRKTDMHNPQSY